MEDTYSQSSTSSPSSSRPVKGKDLFSASVLTDPKTRSTFYRVMAAMHNLASSALPTPTHAFFNTLARKGKLVRVYTQNIDGLEVKAGLDQATATTSSTSNISSSTSVLSPTTSAHAAGRTSKKRSSFSKAPTGQVVHLHGQASLLRCELGTCTYRAPFTTSTYASYSSGSSIPCPGCLTLRSERLALGKRTGGLRCGRLRPAITLYDEPANEEGAAIGEIQMRDLQRSPDCALIFGTTLQVRGFKALVKEFSKEVHENGGMVVFVNLGAPTKEWDEYIDWHGTCELFATDPVQAYRESGCTNETGGLFVLFIVLSPRQDRRFCESSHLALAQSPAAGLAAPDHAHCTPIQQTRCEPDRQEEQRDRVRVKAWCSLLSIHVCE